MRSLRDYDRLAFLYQPLHGAMVLAAALVVGVGWWRPQPWILALAIVLILGAVWWVAVYHWLRMEDPDNIRPNAA